MAWIPTALSYGYTAIEILKWLTKNDKQAKPLIDKAQAAGYSPEEIINHLAKSIGSDTKKSRPLESGTAMQKYTSQALSNKSFADIALQKTIQSAPGLIAGGLAARSLGPLAGSVTDMIGDYIGSKINQPSISPTSNINNQGMNQGQPPQNEALPKTETPENPFGTTELTVKSKNNLADIAKDVAATFGFKNTKVINAVSDAVAMGMNVKQVYNRVKDMDISTPEKATKTIKQILEENKFLKEQEKLDKEGKFKPSEETKEKLQSDLKSSVIRFTDYNPSDSIAKVVFNNGHTYIYKDVPEDTYRKFVSADTPAKTTGENQYGMWWKGKSPSLGASFNENIKKPGFAYKRIGNTPFEQKEYLKESEEAKKSYKEFTSGEKKAKEASKNIKKGKIKTSELVNQLQERKIKLLSDLTKIKSKKGEDRKKALRENIIERLQVIKDENSLKTMKKKKTTTDKNLSAKEVIKKILPFLNTKQIIRVKKQVSNLNEEEALNFILDVIK